MKSLRLTFSENLKIIRRSKSPKISGEKLAELMNITITTLYKWENGKSEPSFENIQQLADILEVPPYLFFMDSQKPTEITPGLQDLKKTLLETTRTLKFFQEQMENPEFFEKKKLKSK